MTRYLTWTRKGGRRDRVLIHDTDEAPKDCDVVSSSPTLNGIRRQLAIIYRYGNPSADFTLTYGRKEWRLWVSSRGCDLSGYYAGMIAVRDVQQRGKYRRKADKRAQRKAGAGESYGGRSAVCGAENPYCG